MTSARVGTSTQESHETHGVSFVVATAVALMKSTWFRGGSAPWYALFHEFREALKDSAPCLLEGMEFRYPPPRPYSSGLDQALAGLRLMDLVRDLMPGDISHISTRAKRQLLSVGISRELLEEHRAELEMMADRLDRELGTEEP